MDLDTLQTNPDIDEQVAQAFKNINNLIIRTLEHAGHPAQNRGKSGWGLVVNLRAYFVGLSNIRSRARDTMVRAIKQWCPDHQPLFTMVGIESLPFPEHRVELEVRFKSHYTLYLDNTGSPLD